MQIFTSPDGREFEVDDPSLPEVQSWLQANKLSPKPSNTTKDVVKSLISGGIEGIPRALLLGGDAIKLGLTGLNHLRPGTVSDETVNRFGSQAWIDAFKDSPQDKGLKNVGIDATHNPETTPGRYAKAGAEAVVGGATMGGLGAVGKQGLTAARVALTPAQLAINGGAGVAAEFGGDVSRGFDSSKPMNPLVMAMFGLGTGGAGQVLNSSLRRNLNQVVHNATASMSPTEWEKAQRDLQSFQRSGSQSFTLADLPDLQPRIGGLARGLSDQTGGDLLQRKLSLDARGNNDIPKLLSEAADVSPGTVDPREIAAAVGRQADARLSAVEKSRTNALLGNLDRSGNVNPVDLLAATNNTVRNALRQGTNQGRGTRQALNKAEEALLGRDALSAPLIGQVTPDVTNVRSLSTNVKSLNDMPTRDAGNARTAIRNSDRAQAYGAADEALKQASPGYRQSMTQYGDTTENIIKPLENSLTGATRKVTNFSTLLEKLRQVPPDKISQEISRMGLSDADTLQLAKAVGQGLHPVPNLAMTHDLTDRKIFQALVEHVDPSMAAHSNNKIDVADALSRLSGTNSAATDVMLNLGKNPVSNVVSPLSTASLRARLRTSASETAKLSDLIGNPTPENLAKLRELSKVDPRAKRALEWISTAAGALTATQAGQ